MAQNVLANQKPRNFKAWYSPVLFSPIRIFFVLCGIFVFFNINCVVILKVIGVECLFTRAKIGRQGQQRGARHRLPVYTCFDSCCPVKLDRRFYFTVQVNPGYRSPPGCGVLWALCLVCYGGEMPLLPMGCFRGKGRVLIYITTFTWHQFIERLSFFWEALGSFGQLALSCCHDR